MIQLNSRWPAVAKRKPAIAYEAAPPNSTEKANLIRLEVIFRGDGLEIAVETHDLAKTYRSTRPMPRSPCGGAILSIRVEESQKYCRLDDCHFVFFEIVVEHILRKTFRKRFSLRGVLITQYTLARRYIAHFISFRDEYPVLWTVSASTNFDSQPIE